MSYLATVASFCLTHPVFVISPGGEDEFTDLLVKRVPLHVHHAYGGEEGVTHQLYQSCGVYYSEGVQYRRLVVRLSSSAN